MIESKRREVHWMDRGPVRNILHYTDLSTDIYTKALACIMISANHHYLSLNFSPSLFFLSPPPLLIIIITNNNDDDTTTNNNDDITDRLGFPALTLPLLLHSLHQDLSFNFDSPNMANQLVGGHVANDLALQLSRGKEK